jgi:ribosomal protein S12 methylthiotransferase accessory factor
MSRAVTEAAQSRLTAIAGSRDDLPSFYSQVRNGSRQQPCWPQADLGFQDVAGLPLHLDVSVELAATAQIARRVAGAEPLVVDLSTDDEFSVVRVIVPGMMLNMDRVHERTEDRQDFPDLVDTPHRREQTYER